MRACVRACSCGCRFRVTGDIRPSDLGRLKEAQPQLVIGTPATLMKLFAGIPGLKNNDREGLTLNGALLKFLVLDEVGQKDEDIPESVEHRVQH